MDTLNIYSTLKLKKKNDYNTNVANRLKESDFINNTSNTIDRREPHNSEGPAYDLSRSFSNYK